MEYGKGTLHYNDFMEGRREAQIIARLIDQVIPGYPEGFEIKTVEDIHEAATQQDIHQTLAQHYVGQLDYNRYAAQEDDVDGPDSDLAQEHFDRAVLIANLIPRI